MKLLKWSKYIKFAAVFLVGAVAAKSALEITSASSDPAWGYVSTNPAYEIQHLKKQITEYDKLNTLLDDRSRTWSNMELLTKLTPSSVNLKISKFDYSIDVNQSNATSGKIPVIRSWDITGQAELEDRSYLDSLNSVEGMSSVFDSVYQVTQDESFNTEVANRRPRPNIKIKINSKANRRNSTTLPIDFVMTITQRLDGSDPLTLPLAKK